MKPGLVSLVVVTVACAVIATGCCGPLPAEEGDEDDNLTVDVAVYVDDVREPVCDAEVVAFVVDAETETIDEDAPIALVTSTLDDRCVYRAVGVKTDAYEVRVHHPEHGDATALNVGTDTSDGSCVRFTGADGVDESVVLGEIPVD